MLLAGVYTRIVAFILTGEMAFAYFMAHAPRSFYPIANRGGLAVLFCFIFLYLAFPGSGPWGVDRAVLKQDLPPRLTRPLSEAAAMIFDSPPRTRVFMAT
jgi:putative oxidoreductase